MKYLCPEISDTLWEISKVLDEAIITAYKEIHQQLIRDCRLNK